MRCRVLWECKLGEPKVNLGVRKAGSWRVSSSSQGVKTGRTAVNSRRKTSLDVLNAPIWRSQRGGKQSVISWLLDLSTTPAAPLKLLCAGEAPSYAVQTHDLADFKEVYRARSRLLHCYTLPFLPCFLSLLSISVCVVRGPRPGAVVLSLMGKESPGEFVQNSDS